MLTPHFFRRQVSLAATLVCTSFALIQVANAQVATQNIAIEIPAQSAEQALKKFAEATKFQLIFSPDIVRGLVTKSISGTMSPREALNRMFDGSSVVIIETGENAVTIRLKANTSKLPDAIASEVVTVTGIRRGVEGAISVKKISDNIVEAIAAEDIGKLPDVSIAESIARLPGLSAQRVAGRAQTISIRGLSPDFSTTLLNGREQVSIGDNRSVEFDQYPSELMSGVTIYKTSNASLVGQGLSGTIDMQTIRPLSLKERTIAVNTRSEKNSLGNIADEKSSGNRLSATYIDQFADGTFGVALGYAHMDSPILAQQNAMYVPWSTTARPGVAAGVTSPSGITATSRGGANNRDAVMATLEWKPSNQWSSTLDAYASKFVQTQTDHVFELPLTVSAAYAPAFKYLSTNVSSENVLTGGTVSGASPILRGIFANREDTINSVGWNNKFKFDGWSLLADLNFSRAQRDEKTLESNAMLRDSNGKLLNDTIQLNWAGGTTPIISPTLNYADPSRLFIGTTRFGAGYGTVTHVEDELHGFKISANSNVPDILSSIFSDADIGLSYSTRTKNKSQPAGSITSQSNLTGGTSVISSELLGSNVGMNFSGLGQIPSWNVPAVTAKYLNFAPSTSAGSFQAGSIWEVKEQISVGFAKANIDTQWNSIRVRGNTGIQIQSTEQSSSSRIWDSTAPAGKNFKPFSDGEKYSDVLPSMNLVMGLPNDEILRFGIAKQIARPRIDQLGSGSTFALAPSTLIPTGSGGNAKLQPWRANSLDMSFEKYFSNKGYVSAAAFYKNLTSYIYQVTQTDHDYSNLIAGTNASSPIGNYTSPFNGEGGKLSGFELTASVPLSMVSNELNGFGLIASTAVNNSSIKIQDPNSNIGSNLPLPGMSKNVSSITLYFEKEGFTSRLSQRKRSDFIGEITGFGASRTLRYVKGESVVDMQIGYNFTHDQLKGLGLILQVNNLTNATYQTYSGTPDKLVDFAKYGRTVLMGANYKF
jgi:iron complex outermembrane receptor protein